MPFIEPLDEEEAYLWAILSDPSGLDQAEFSWTDPRNDDNCFRAYPYQHLWWRDDSQNQIDQCARSVGKSESIKVRAYAFPFLHPGSEMVITAPEGVHLDTITDNIETGFVSNRLGSELLMAGRTGIKHRPFHMNFSNGARIMGRIPQRDGKGVKGIHPVWLELDEGQDYPDKGWVELFETPNMNKPEDMMWRVHGVTRGVRDYFHKFTEIDSGWRVHRITAMHRPSWTDAERQKKIEQYGSKDSPDYRRNVLGLHGDATNPIFVLHRLMACVDSDQASDYNDFMYCKLKINNEQVLEYDDNILPLLDVPASHQNLKHVYIGADIGYTNDPTEILVFSEEPGPRAKDDTRFRIVTRVALQRVSHQNQVAALLWLINFYRPHMFSMDKTGLGLPLFQALQHEASQDPNMRSMIDKIKGYNFSEKILVDYDMTKPYDEFLGEPSKDAEIWRIVLEYSTDVLRDLVDRQRLILPYDKEIITEFQGQTYTVKADRDMYGRSRNFSKGTFHTLDAARMAMLGWKQQLIEDMTKEDHFEVIEPVFL
jgi:hypothetical protein